MTVAPTWNRRWLIGLVVSLVAAKGALAQPATPRDPGSFANFLMERDPALSELFAAGQNALEVKNQVVDKTTGLIPPTPPVQAKEAVSPDDAEYSAYAQALADFLDKRKKILSARREYEDRKKTYRALTIVQPPGAPLFDRNNYFVSKVTKWNGAILWAPASATDDINLQFGDEARAVFGPIPPFDVTTLGKRVLPDGSSIETGQLVVEVEGNQALLKPNPNKPGSPLEYEHHDANGNVIKWTSTIDKCDKPSLAGGVSPCGTASRLSHIARGNVDWIALARKTIDVNSLAAISYWGTDDPNYTLVGYFGYNRLTGEVVFFDGSYVGSNTPTKWNWKGQLVPPGGSGYADTAGRQAAAAQYDATFKIGCVACHEDKKPFILTPYVKQARVGYADPKLAAAFSLGELLPQVKRRATSPYRVVGSAYTAAHAQLISGDRTVVDPNGSCNQCHGLTTNGTGRFASDAVGKLGSLQGDTGVENGFRTEWALRSGAGKILPWMIPDDGNDTSTGGAVLSDAEWASLKAVIDTPVANSIPVFTEAPAPESQPSATTRIGDPASPTEFGLTAEKNRDDDSVEMAKELHLSWKYLNSFGGVPERDDVRFNVAIRELDIPAGGAPPSSGDYPSIDQSKGLSAIKIGDSILLDGSTFILADLSYVGHLKWTDPAPAMAQRLYRVDFPATTGKRYLVRVVAKRFGFDQGGERFSSADHTVYIDNR